jgi:hypothetical protein
MEMGGRNKKVRKGKEVFFANDTGAHQASTKCTTNMCLVQCTRIANSYIYIYIYTCFVWEEYRRLRLILDQIKFGPLYIHMFCTIYNY